MEWLDVGDGRSIWFPAVNTNRAGFAELNSDNSRRRISAEKKRIFLEFHSERFLDFARNDKCVGQALRLPFVFATEAVALEWRSVIRPE